MNLAQWSQLGIACTGAVAVVLTQARTHKVRRLACLFGTAGQPFWFYAAWSAHQWGIFALCFLYAFAWLKGVWQWWVLPWAQKEP